MGLLGGTVSLLDGNVGAARWEMPSTWNSIFKCLVAKGTAKHYRVTQFILHQSLTISDNWGFAGEQVSPAIPGPAAGARETEE